MSLPCFLVLLILLYLLSSLFCVDCCFCSSPPAIEIGFTQARVEHNESQATFEAVLAKDRQSEQTFFIRIQISTPRIPDVAEPATTLPSTPPDFIVGFANVLRVTLTPADNSTVLPYQIIGDNIPENTEIFQLSAAPDPDIPSNPDFDCDNNRMFRFDGRDCFPDLQVLILDDDGESPAGFYGILIGLMVISVGQIGLMTLTVTILTRLK